MTSQPSFPSDAPLAGVRVLETATYISGPLAGMMLADLGADVLKVEPPRGDPLRRFGQPTAAMSSQFASCNHGKRSITMDLKESTEIDRLLQLAEDADVYISNTRPAAAARLGLSDEVLAARNPSLIRVYTSGFGVTGPEAAQPAFDSTIQARTGLAFAQGGARPELVHSWVYDKFTAHQLAQATLAALVGRARTGLGSRVDVAMLAAGAYINFPDIMADRTFTEIVNPTEAARMIAANFPLPASDGWLVVSPVSGAQIKRTCRAAGIEDAVPHVLGAPTGVEVTERLMAALEAQTPSRSVADWLRIFGDLDVPCSPCMTIDEHLADAQVVDSDLYSMSEWEGIGLVRQARYPAAFSGWTQGEVRPAPRLGEHNGSLWASGDRARSA